MLRPTIILTNIFYTVAYLMFSLNTFLYIMLTLIEEGYRGEGSHCRKFEFLLFILRYREWAINTIPQNMKINFFLPSLRVIFETTKMLYNCIFEMLIGSSKGHQIKSSHQQNGFPLKQFKISMAIIMQSVNHYSLF